MKIRTKTIISISIACLIIFGALHLAASYLIMPSYEDIENQQSQEGVCQALTTLNFMLSQMKNKVVDYAAWDETYSFIQSYDPNYVKENLDTSFENLNLNLVATIDNSGNMVYCKVYDDNYSEPTDCSQETVAQLQADTTIWTFQTVDDAKSGMILLGDDKILLLATAPIVTNQKDGPMRGGMLFGSYLDSQEVDMLSEIMGLNFTVTSGDVFENQTDGEQIFEALTLNPQTVLVEASSSEVVSGYTIINDVNEAPMFVLQVNQTREFYQHGIATRNIFIAAALVLSVAFGFSVSIILKKQIITPLTDLATYVKTTFSEPNTKSHPKKGTDEVSVLANAIKDSVNQKLDTMNEVSRMVAHDLRNPLTGIKGATYALQKNYGQELGEKGVGLLGVIDDCVEYSNKIVSDLWEYSSEIKLEKTKNSTYQLVTKALTTFTTPKNIKIINYTNNEYLLNVDAAKIERVFSNIAKNAIDAMPDGGTLKITSEKSQKDVEIEFSDTGVGMSGEIVKKIGSPFFTTKAKGMGIGFSICKRLVEAHRGRIEVKSVEGKGTKIAVFLPI